MTVQVERELWDLQGGAKWIADLIAAMLTASRRQGEQAALLKPQSVVEGRVPALVQAEVALAALRGEPTLAEMAQQYDHPLEPHQQRQSRLLEARS